MLLRGCWTHRRPAGVLQDAQTSTKRPIRYRKKERSHQSTVGNSTAAVQRQEIQTANNIVDSGLRQQNDKAKLYDVIALGNLCVDIFVRYQDQMPPLEEIKKIETLEGLTEAASKGDDSDWEAGAQSNFMIAAGRLGMKVAAAANLGDDIYGHYLADILHKEGVQKIIPLSPQNFKEHIDYTLICFVLIDPQGRHHFCSRYDFGPWPLLPDVQTLTPTVQQALSQTEAIFLNGCIFDEIPGHVVLSIIQTARNAGAATFFDPGPRSQTLATGERKRILDALLDICDVVLMTQEEAEAVTGLSDPEEAAKFIMERPGALTQWCVVKLGPQGALIRTKHPPQTLRQKAIKVPVVDTVGCGDSFAAAIVMGFTQQKQLQPTLSLANAVGAATAMSSGAGRNVATADNVTALLEQQASSFSGAGSDVEYSDWAEKVADETSSSMRQEIITAGKEDQQGSGDHSNGNNVLSDSEVAAQALQMLRESLRTSVQ